MPGLRIPQIIAPAVVAPPAQQSVNVTPQVVNSFATQASTLANDEDKYQAAVDLARLDLQDKDKVTDSMFKNAIDSYYEQFDPEKSGREMRGENAWTDFVGGTKDAIDSFNVGVGNALDFVGDNTVGGIMELAGAKDAAKDWRNMVTGEDLAIIPDIMTDVALTATGVGIPAMIAKNAIQLSPQMAQGISGKDAITLEDMDTGQQAANAALGFGGLALSAIPGIGKGINVARAAGKDAAKKNLGLVEKAMETAKQDAKSAKKAADNPEKLNDAMMDKLDDLGKTFDKGEYSDDAFKEFEKAADAASDLEGKREQANKALREAAGELKSAKEWEGAGTFKRALDVIGQDFTGLGRGITTLPEAISETRNLAKGAKSARKMAKESNADAEPGKYADVFRGKVADAAEEANGGKVTEEEIAKFAKENLGIKNLEELPVKSSAFREGQIGRKARRNAVNESSEKLSKEEKNRIYEDAIEAYRNTKKLRPGGFKGRGPIRSAQNYYRSAMDNILEKANAGAPEMIDDSALKALLRNEAVRKMEGAKGVGARLGNAALNPVSRMAGTAAGMGSGVGLVPLAEVAQNGGSYSDAIGSIADKIDAGEVNPAAVIPMLLTGSKNISKRVNPGLRGTVGRSAIPHNAMRSISGAENWNPDPSMDNEGFQAALKHLRDNEKKEK